MTDRGVEVAGERPWAADEEPRRGDAPHGGRALDAPFRPRLARWVTVVMGVLVIVGAVVLVVLLPTDGPTRYSAGDRAGILVVGGLIAWFCQRQATVRAVPGPDGLTVRNLVVTRTIVWAEIVSVRFGQGRPWVQLDLADGDTIAVMGVQRSDGPSAEREARRLATLVAVRTRTTRDD